MSWWSLPEDWDTVLLGPLVKIKSGFACAKKNLVPANQGIAHLRPFNIATNGKVDLSEVYYIPTDYKDGTEAYALEPGHVLFNNTNSVELVGKTALVTEPMQCVFSNHIYRLTVKAKARLDPTWLALTLRALWTKSYFAEYCNRWIGQAGFNQKMLRDLEIPVPHPDDPARSLETQRRIVARIEGLFAELGAARRLHAALAHDAERLMDAALIDVFPFSEHTFAKGRFVSKLSDETCCEIVAGQHILSKKYSTEKIGFPYITGPADFGSKYPIISKWTESPKVFCAPGDVLLTVKGAGVGKVNCAPQNERTCIGRQIMALHPNTKCITGNFLYYFLQSRFEIFQKMGRSATVPGISKDQVGQVKIPVPPLTEQTRITAHFDQVQAHAAELQRTAVAVAADLDRLEQSILAQAFKGAL